MGNQITSIIGKKFQSNAAKTANINPNHKQNFIISPIHEITNHQTSNINSIAQIANNPSIIADKNWGPAFGGGADLGVGCAKELLEGWSNKNSSNTFIKNRELTKGKSEFSIEEMEVFLLNRNLTLLINI